MRLPPTSVRLRLVAWYVATLVVLVAGYTAVLLTVVRREAIQDMDTALRTELAVFVDRHELGQGTPGLTDGSASSAASGAASFELSEAGQPTVDAWRVDPRLQVLVDGRRLRGTGVTAAHLPAFAEQREGQPFEIVEASGTWRAMRAVATQAGRDAVLFQVSLPLAPVDALSADLRRYAGWSMLGLLVLACGGGVLIAGEALAPINGIIRGTRAIRPGQLGARLPVGGPADEVAELSGVINDLLDRLQTALRKEAQFATEAAHELRTPLTAQRAVGELALRGQASTAELREAVSSMLEEGEHMQKLIDSLLIVARADGGLLPMAVRATDAASLAERCVRSMQPLADLKEQTLSVAVAPPCPVLADETLLRQALLNLVHNAIEHTPQHARISVEVRAEATGVLIAVTDNGPGFATYEKDQVIRRHARRKGDHRGRGLGLGLTIAQALVRSQGGRMAVLSRPGLGTVIELRFDTAPTATAP